MRNGYNLVEFTNIQYDDGSECVVTNVDYNTISYLGCCYTADDVINICDEYDLENSILMIVEVENKRVVNCCHMVFLAGDRWVLDVCEWDYRVYASVAFGEDLT